MGNHLFYSGCHRRREQVLWGGVNENGWLAVQRLSNLVRREHLQILLRGSQRIVVEESNLLLNFTTAHNAATVSLSSGQPCVRSRNRCINVMQASNRNKSSKSRQTNANHSHDEPTGTTAPHGSTRHSAIGTVSDEITHMKAWAAWAKMSWRCSSVCSHVVPAFCAPSIIRNSSFSSTSLRSTLRSPGHHCMSSWSIEPGSCILNAYACMHHTHGGL